MEEADEEAAEEEEEKEEDEEGPVSFEGEAEGDDSNTVLSTPRVLPTLPSQAPLEVRRCCLKSATRTE